MPVWLNYCLLGGEALIFLLFPCRRLFSPEYLIGIYAHAKSTLETHNAARDSQMFLLHNVAGTCTSSHAQRGVKWKSRLQNETRFFADKEPLRSYTRNYLIYEYETFCACLH